ncbi:hypothetical protein INR49_023777, partial [Caranx melampygus]
MKRGKVELQQDSAVPTETGETALPWQRGIACLNGELLHLSIPISSPLHVHLPLPDFLKPSGMSLDQRGGGKMKVRWSVMAKEEVKTQMKEESQRVVMAFTVNCDGSGGLDCSMKEERRGEERRGEERRGERGRMAKITQECKVIHSTPPSARAQVQIVQASLVYTVRCSHGNKSSSRMKRTLVFVLTLAGLSAVSARVLQKNIYVNKSLPWHEAQIYCREKYNELAPVTDNRINNRLQRLIHGVEQPVWIGLQDDMRRWVWSFGDQLHLNHLNFQNWRSDQPDNRHASENCTLITIRGYWVDAPCMDQHPVVCFRETGPVKYTVVETPMTRHKIRFQSKADLKDPALQRQVLEQLHVKLKEHGLPHYKLSWLHTDEQTYNWEQEKTEEGICRAINPSPPAGYNHELQVFPYRRRPIFLSLLPLKGKLKERSEEQRETGKERGWGEDSACIFQ